MMLGGLGGRRYHRNGEIRGGLDSRFRGNDIIDQSRFKTKMMLGGLGGKSYHRSGGIRGEARIG